jgi:hypothetical protein
MEREVTWVKSFDRSLFKRICQMGLLGQNSNKNKTASQVPAPNQQRFGKVPNLKLAKKGFDSCLQDETGWVCDLNKAQSPNHALYQKIPIYIL